MNIPKASVGLPAYNGRPLEVAEEADGPRVCLPTVRNFARHIYRSAGYESEDVLTESANTDLLHLEPGKQFALRARLLWNMKLLEKDVSRGLAYVNPGLRPARVTKDYDLFMFVCPVHMDVLNFNVIRGWKKRCKTSVCWIHELWAANLPRYKHWLFRLREFDHVILSFKDSVEAVSDAIGRRCHHVPGGVDALRFCPYPNSPARVINVYSIGRRLKGPHQALLKWASDDGIFYVHDTFGNPGATLASDYLTHRNAYANMAKRSQLFMVAPGSVDLTNLTRGQVEVGFRYFEGAAAGAVLVGQSPNCEAFQRSFDWPDSVVEINPDGSDAVEVLTALLADQNKVAGISRRNATEALLRHDWVYRWKEIFAIAGIKPTRAMEARERRLKALAALVGEELFI